MLNTMIVVKMKKTNFSEWKKLFDGDAENRAKFARDTLVGKVDENTAIGVAEGEGFEPFVFAMIYKHAFILYRKPVP